PAYEARRRWTVVRGKARQPPAARYRLHKRRFRRRGARAARPVGGSGCAATPGQAGRGDGQSCQPLSVGCKQQLQRRAKIIDTHLVNAPIHVEPGLNWGIGPKAMTAVYALSNRQFPRGLTPDSSLGKI